MSLRTARLMGDVSRPLDVVHDDPCVPSNELASLTDTQLTESDIDYDDNSDYFHYDFPQPPSMTPALRRMRSSPWYLQQLEALSKPERRHSVSPLIQHPGGWSHPLLPLDPQGSTGRDVDIGKELVHMGLVSRNITERSNEILSENCERMKPQFQRDACSSRRLDQLPPPAPAPSIPLPRLPRIIRKVASMRSESKQELVGPMASSRRPVPKIRSLKFMSGSMLGSNILQSANREERKRSWSLSRPTSFQKHKLVPASDAPYVTLNSTNDYLSMSYDPAPTAYAAPTVYSNPCLIESSIEHYIAEGHFDLSRGDTSLAPPFAHRAMRSAATHRYSNSHGESTVPRLGYNPRKTGSSICHEYTGVHQHQPSHSLYGIRGGSQGKNPSSGALLQGAKSFINITPEKRKSRSKSGRRSVDVGNERGSVGHQVGSVMKEKSAKVKRLFVRASSGVVDWGRQLTGRTTKLVAASSTSGSLAPLTDKRS